MKKILILLLILFSFNSYSEKEENDIIEDTVIENYENINNDSNDVIEIIEKETEKEEENKVINNNIEKKFEEKEKKEKVEIVKENKKNDISKLKNVIKPIEKEEEKEIVKVDKKSSIYIKDYDVFLIDEKLDAIHPLASLTKVMTAVIVLDAIEKGSISLEDEIIMDNSVANIGGSWLNTKVGTSYTVEELLKALLVYSANNSAYALAKYVSKGNLDNFILKMNEKARNLGMNSTTYYTPAGLPTSFTNKPLDVSTIRDQVKLALHVLKNEKLMEIAGLSTIILDNGKGNLVEYKNRNKLISKDGNIGLKTGFHNSAGYNMIGIFDNKGIISIAVTLGDESDAMRFKHQKELNNKVILDEILLIDKERFDYKLKLEKSQKEEVELYIKEDFYGLKSYNVNFEVRLNKDIYREVKKDEQIGEILVKYKGKIIKKIPMYSLEEVKEKNNFIYLFLIFPLIILLFLIYKKKLTNKK